MNGFDDRWNDPSSFQERKTDFGGSGGGAGGWDADGDAGGTDGWGGWSGGKKAAESNGAKAALDSEAGGWGEWKPEKKSNFPARSSRDLDSVDVPPQDFRSLPPFEKSFYVEHPNVTSMTASDVAAYRQKREIVVEGKDVPKPICSFKEASFPDYVLEGVLKAGFKEPTAIQAQGWPMALKGRDLIGLAVTGSGKTLAYLLPAIVHVNAQPVLSPGDGPIVLILAPTRELAVQIQQEATKFGSSSR